MTFLINTVLFSYIMSLYFFTFLPGLNNISNAIAAIFIFLVALQILAEKKTIIFNSFLILYLLFITVCLISYFYAVNQQIALTMIISLSLYFVFIFFFTNYLDDYKKIVNVLHYFIVAGVSASIYLLINSEFSNIQRIGELLGNINAVGMMLDIPSLFCVYFILFEKKYWYLPATLICIGVVLATGSRGAIGMLIFGILLLLYFNTQGNIKGRLKGVVLGAIILVLSYFLLFEIPFFYQIAGSRIENILKFIHSEKINEGSIVIRSFMIKFGLDIFKENPIIGYGINNYRVFLGKEIGWMTYAHNNYIELLVGIGIIGTTIYYSMHISLLSSLFRLKDKSGLKFLFLSFLLPIFVIDFASVNYYDKHIFIVLALCSAFLKINKLAYINS